MKKHAYLIIAHNEFYILEKLIKLIDNEKNDIFLHIDKKVKKFDFKKFERMVKKSNLYFTKRIDVVWASSSQIKCELLMLEEATKKGNYSYYHLISGVDLPIKSQEYIHDFFDNCGNKEFIHYRDYDKLESHLIPRVKYYHLFVSAFRDKSFKGKIKYKFYNLFMKIQYKLKINRAKNNNYRSGANWFSITDDCARYIVKNKKEILKQYKYTRCADEIFLQSLILNTKYFDNLYLKSKDNNESIMRLIDWNRGKPYTFKLEDYEELINSDMLFARKFSTKDNKKLIDKIYEKIKGDSK